MKVCFCSDNHGDYSSIAKILHDNPACDYYVHAGDSLLDPEELRPFISVAGNNDWDFDYPRKRILEYGGHRILLMHGHGYTYNMNGFAARAKEEKCDVVFFGHTHTFTDKTISGIRFINPGSCYFNRDLSAPCYARVYFMDDFSIKAERIDL